MSPDETQTITSSSSPGQLVPLYDRRLHLLAQGSGEVAVILDGAGGAGTAGWAEAAARLAPHARVVRYDRAGFGASDPAPTPLTADDSAQDLRTALERAGVKGPFLPVGHAYGASVMRCFAYRYHREVVGLVLLDARPPGFESLAPRAWRASSRLQQARWRLQALLPRSGPGAARAGREALARESAAYGDSDREVAALPAPQPPLIVVSHGEPDLFAHLPGEAAAQAEELWQRLQRQLASATPGAKLWIAEGAGHDLPAERPDLVVRAVQEILTKR